MSLTGRHKGRYDRCMEKLVSRTEFARLAGVTPGAVTKAAKTSLLEAVNGKYIDANHAAAIKFMEKAALDKTPPPLPGIDPLYEKALEACLESGLWGTPFLRSTFHIGGERAKKLRDQIKAAKEQSRAEKVIPVALTEPKAPHVRGTALLKQKRIAADSAPLDEVVIPDNIAAFADMTIRDVIKKYGTAERFTDYLKALKEIGIMAEREIRLAEIKGQLVSRAMVQTQVVEQFDEAHMKLLRDGSKTIAIQVSAMCEAGESIEDIEKFISEKITDFIRPVKAKIAKALRHDRG